MADLEAALPAGSPSLGGSGNGAAPAPEVAVVQSLPTIVSHLHDYFVHVAALLGQLHAQVGVTRSE